MRQRKQSQCGANINAMLGLFSQSGAVEEGSKKRKVEAEAAAAANGKTDKEFRNLVVQILSLHDNKIGEVETYLYKAYSCRWTKARFSCKRQRLTKRTCPRSKGRSTSGATSRTRWRRR